jgi:hypothetical protein
MANCRVDSVAGCRYAAVCGASIEQEKEAAAHCISSLLSRIRILFYFISYFAGHLNILILSMVTNQVFPITLFSVCLNHGYNPRSLQPQQSKPHYNAEPVYITAEKPLLNSQIRISDFPRFKSSQIQIQKPHSSNLAQNAGQQTHRRPPSTLQSRPLATCLLSTHHGITRPYLETDRQSRHASTYPQSTRAHQSTQAQQCTPLQLPCDPSPCPDARSIARSRGVRRRDPPFSLTII